MYIYINEYYFVFLITSQQSRDNGPNNRCLGLGMNFREKLEDDTITGHRIKNTRKWKHRSEKIGTKSKNCSDIDDPHDGRPANLFKDIGKRSLWILRQKLKIEFLSMIIDDSVW